MEREGILEKLRYYFSLDAEIEDYAKVHEGIVKDSIFKGTNLWILSFAIILASIGLNMNSPAVIIGAMLISPLMGPINGMGYSIATYNFELFRQTIKNFTFAVLTSLLASTLYFAISPVSTAHHELLARTSPTIYDVLVALFGGLAGIFAMASKQKGNVIPGVAIATALMPPLCTAGYGIATGQITFFLGATYLFTINTVFIAVASIVASHVLKFPFATTVDSSRRKKVNQIVTLIILLVLIPSIYFGYGLVKKERFLQNAQLYITQVSSVGGLYLIDHETNASKQIISLTYAGNAMDSITKDLIIQKAKPFGLSEYNLEINQGFAIQQHNALDAEQMVIEKEMAFLKSKLSENELALDSLKNRNLLGKTILDEINSLYPQITQCLYAESLEFSNDAQTPLPKSVVVFRIQNGNLTKAEKAKIVSWVSKRLKSNNISVIFE